MEKKGAAEGEKKERSRLQRILALVGVFLLLALYVATFVSAVLSSPASHGLFLASLTCTMVIPLAIYVLRWLLRVFGNKKK